MPSFSSSSRLEIALTFFVVQVIHTVTRKMNGFCLFFYFRKKANVFGLVFRDGMLFISMLNATSIFII